jgi:hypothetical protein
MPLNYQIERLDINDLDAIELEVNPSHDLVRALVRCIKDQRYEMAEMEVEFQSLMASALDGLVDNAAKVEKTYVINRQAS